MFVSKGRPGISLEEHDVILDMDGFIIKGHEILNKIIGNSLSIESSKKCRTCRFSVFFCKTKSKDQTKICYRKIPDLLLHAEEVKFYQKLSKPVTITKYYKYSNHGFYNTDIIIISLNNKFVKDIPFDIIDLNNIKNLKQLNKKLNLIKTFQ